MDHLLYYIVCFISQLLKMVDISPPTLMVALSLPFQSSRRYLSMLQERQNLPAWQEKEQILCLLKKCQVLVVSGMTG